MATLSIPSRSDYSCVIEVGNTISGEIRIEEKSVLIAPVKSGSEYTVGDSAAIEGSLAQFPAAN